MSLVQLGLLSAICTPFAVAGWTAARYRPPAPGAGDDAWTHDSGTHDSGTHDSGTHDAWHPPPTVDDIDHGPLDLAATVLAAAEAMGDLARSRFVRVELAVNPDIKAGICHLAMNEALLAAIRTAICSAPGGQVLITGAVLAGRPCVNVLDDGGETNQTARETLAGGIAAWLTPRGGSVSVAARPGQGTMVSLVLPPVREVRERVNDLYDMPGVSEQMA